MEVESVPQVPTNLVQENGDFVNDRDDGDSNNNPGALTNGTTLASDTAIEGRITKKAKRRLKRSPSKETPILPADHSTTNVALNNVLKDRRDRKSRSGKGRGLPKKGGAGGKGTWGKMGELYDENDADCYDINDPNYDSENQDDYTVKTVIPVLSDEEVVEMIEPIFQEFFEHGDTDEVAACLSDLAISETFSPKVPALVVTLALEKKATQRELTSRLISDLCSKRVISEDTLRAAFEKLMSDLPDLTLDTPDAPMILGQFIARAIADDCLPHSFVQSYKSNTECEHGRKALERAHSLLSVNHGIHRMDNVWGVGGGIRPVKILIKKMVLLLKEYLSSGDVQEAIRCLQELEVPHFHHELVYESVVMALEVGGENTTAKMVKLLKELYSTTVITYDQLVAGFERVFDALPDLVLDVPYAYQIMESFGDLCLKEKLMSPQMRDRVPSRGRKRFVSEGDGGRVKE
ncbi:programmed cell death protein 4-like [Diadema setosum]|uniref:programmed cell death protein 4-like n=1 Tax=Diadema setosum TaxID=31175 RepID=UPI003B3B088C